ncbi:SMI1/KNR4 family protein [Streptomyces thermolilacinus]
MKGAGSTGGPWLRKLVALMPPHEGAGDTVDWAQVQASLGVALPQDYMSFVGTYGPGSVGDTLYVCAPPGMELDWPTVNRIAPHAMQAPELQSWQGPVTHSLEHLLLWGETCSADTFCWLTLGESPDDWPVAVWQRGRGDWMLYDCGMVEFLTRLLRADFDACPMTDVSIWGDPAPLFLHPREEDRLREMGLDPWTGEPDPLAGMRYE